MVSYIFRRLMHIIPILLGIVVITFLILHMIPGDPAAILLGPEASKEEIEQMRELLGLNQNVFIQLLRYLTNLVQLDLGQSLVFQEPVAKLILDTFPATLELAVTALIISLIVAVPLGIFAAIRQNTWVDYGGMLFAQIGISMPVFWIGVMLILAFSVSLGWLPSFGRGDSMLRGLWMLVTDFDADALIRSLKKIILPSISLGVMSAALISRMIRSTMLEVLDNDYIRTARAKGTPEWKVILKHAFRNALLPVITIVGLQFGSLLGGAIVTETVFAWPGIGRLLIGAIGNRDFPLVQGIVLAIAFSFALVNLCVDLLYAVINPKVRGMSEN